MDTSTRIVTAMAELLRVQGYAATSMKDLSAASASSVGSIYHAFPGGKAEVAAVALRQSGAAYIQLLPLLLDPHDNLCAGIEAAFVDAGANLASTGWANLCPVATVAGEVADVEPRLREVADEVFGGWVTDLMVYFEGRGLEQSDARTLAWVLLSSLEGAFVMARSCRSVEPLVASGRATAAVCRSFGSKRRVHSDRVDARTAR